MTEAGFHTLWIPLQERFYRVAYYILEDRADALDAVQDLYMKLWKIRDSLDLVRNPGAFGALLMRNLCIDRIRKLNPSEELPDDLPGQVPPPPRQPAETDAPPRPARTVLRRNRGRNRPLSPQHPCPGKPGPQKTEAI